ncbi:hypothetical protein NKG05_09855 [Oerskovia sp. M15]
MVILVVGAAILVPRLLKRRRALEKAREDARVADAVSRALEDVERPKETTPIGS